MSPLDSCGSFDTVPEAEIDALKVEADRVTKSLEGMRTAIRHSLGCWHGSDPERQPDMDDNDDTDERADCILAQVASEAASETVLLDAQTTLNSILAGPTRPAPRCYPNLLWRTTEPALAILDIIAQRLERRPAHHRLVPPVLRLRDLRQAIFEARMERVVVDDGRPVK
jgi:hypothetical protein